VVTRTLPGGTTTYGYDPLDRVTSESGPAKTQNLTYDPNDNRLSDGSGSKTYTPNTDRIVTENGQSISLDAAGNVTQARGLSFVWNQAGQLKSVSQGATLLATYFYDYAGHRTRKVTTASAPQGVGTTIYVYDLYDRLKGEFDGAGNPKLTYVWRDDTLVSIIVNGTPETALYIETDHLGTPIAARNQQGTVVWTWESDAFGTTAANDDPGGTGIHTTINLRFPGQYFDRESGLHYNWHRYYDPKIGRYLSPDLIGIRGGANLMAYARGNPLSFFDPLGLETGVTIWQPVGWRGSSFGHVSTDINGTTWSYGTGGMTTESSSAYRARNDFRDGAEVKLKLTPEQEEKLMQCISKPQGEYNAVTNNCASPIQRCLTEVGVNDFYKTGQTTLGVNGRHVLPVDLGNGLLSSSVAEGSNQYPASKPSGGIRAPWAR
jgi:RHS repeat-associated protein